MAYYDYCCEKCEEKFEIQASMGDDRKWVACPTCKGKKVRQLFDGVYIPSKTRSAKIPGDGGGSSCSSCSGGSCASCG